MCGVPQKLLVDRYDKAFRQPRPQGFTLNAPGPRDEVALARYHEHIGTVKSRTIVIRPNAPLFNVDLGNEKGKQCRLERRLRFNRTD